MLIYPLTIVIFHSYVGNGWLFIDDDLLGGVEHGWIMTFHSVGNVIIPTDEHILCNVLRWRSNDFHLQSSSSIPVAHLKVINSH
jgi:hypothetical protein